MSYLVRQLEKHHLPEDARLVEVLRVPTNTRETRHRTLRSTRVRFALFTPRVYDYPLSEMGSVPPYLCFCKYAVNQTPQEILRSMEGKPFEGPTNGRLLDFCRTHPKRIPDRIAFLSSNGAYFYLKKNADGSHCLRALSDRDVLKRGWLFALQPTTEEVVEDLEQIIQVEDRMQELVAIH